MIRALALVPLVLVLAAPAAASARSAYCSPSGDYCKSTYTQGGKRYFELRSFALYMPPPRYKLCVRDPRRRETCRTFKLRERKGIYRSRVRWSSHFPTDGGRGTYRVRWNDEGFSYGPSLTFRR